MTTPHLTRRALLATTGLAAGSLAVTACTPESSAGPGGESSGSAPARPVHIPYEGVVADVPTSVQGAPQGFRTYPSDNPVAVPEPPASEPITFLSPIAGAPPMNPPQNAYWDELNRKLGAPIGLNGVPSADYGAKLNTMLAGGDLPDMWQMLASVPRLPDAAPSTCADLTEHLSGDAIADYPMLANFPQDAWRDVTFGGHIYGVPYLSPMMGNTMYLRADIAESLGVSGAVETAEEFLELAKAVTDPRNGRWAFSNWSTALGFVKEMFGVPNVWRIEPDGSFTKDYETDEYRAALDFAVRLFAADLVHPDIFAAQPNVVPNFIGGRIALVSTTSTYWPLFYSGVEDEAFAVELVPAPKADGGGMAPKHLLSGTWNFGAINKKSSPERIKELLRVQNYLAAPFGTAEHLLRTYGIEGTHHERVHGSPIMNGDGVSQVTAVPVRYASGTPVATFFPEKPELVDRAVEIHAEMVEGGVSLPTRGLFSETEQTNGSALVANMNDTLKGILQGRETLDSFAKAVAEWRQGGGDTIAEELAAAHAKVDG